MTMKLNHDQAAQLEAAAWNGGQPVAVEVREHAGVVEFRREGERAWRQTDARWARRVAA